LNQEGLGQAPFRETQASQQQGQLLQTAISRLPAELSTQDQQLLTDEENLAVLVTPEQDGRQRVKRPKKQQMEIAGQYADGFWTLTGIRTPGLLVANEGNSKLRRCDAIT
jgi:hypothetical protein